jgi:phage FluMu gp28-like protein
LTTLQFELHAAQSEIFNDSSRFKVVAAGRRFGKSYLSAVVLLIEALKTVNEKGYDLSLKEVWYVAPTFDQARGVGYHICS